LSSRYRDEEIDAEWLRGHGAGKPYLHPDKFGRLKGIASMPRPPALQTAATNSARARLPIGACTIGCRILNFSVSLVVSILAPSLLSIFDRLLVQNSESL
jgi:hypothetical protein